MWGTDKNKGNGVIQSSFTWLTGWEWDEGEEYE